MDKKRKDRLTQVIAYVVVIIILIAVAAPMLAASA